MSLRNYVFIVSLCFKCNCSICRDH